MNEGDAATRAAIAIARALLSELRRQGAGRNLELVLAEAAEITRRDPEATGLLGATLARVIRADDT